MITPSVTGGLRPHDAQSFADLAAVARDWGDRVTIAVWHGDMIATDLATTIAEHAATEGLTIEIVRDPDIFASAWNGNSARAADFNLFRVSSDMPSPRRMLEIIALGGDEPVANRARELIEAGVPPDADKLILDALEGVGDRIAVLPVAHLKAVYLHRRGVTPDIHPDGTLGSFSDFKVEEN